MRDIRKVPKYLDKMFPESLTGGWYDDAGRRVKSWISFPKGKAQRIQTDAVIEKVPKGWQWAVHHTGGDFDLHADGRCKTRKEAMEQADTIMEGLL